MADLEDRTKTVGCSPLDLLKGGRIGLFLKLPGCARQWVEAYEQAAYEKRSIAADRVLKEFAQNPQSHPRVATELRKMRADPHYAESVLISSAVDVEQLAALRAFRGFNAQNATEK